ncbi:hypothetical protein [Saccharothrix sp. ALI-22-I]|uniref:hypothetical protein n=1 Tax=Saccharothrix sp. ALI-22-I TaxID=1933778 RepID=UPI003FD0F9A6
MVLDAGQRSGEHLQVRALIWRHISSAAPNSGHTRTRVDTFSAKVLSRLVPCASRTSSWDRSS